MSLRSNLLPASTRPTRSRIREAIINSLAPRLPGARVLELFAGSGAWGFEALSRGASHCTWIERDPKALQVLGANRGDCLDRFRRQKIEPPTTDIIPSIVTSALLSRLEQLGGGFDFIYVDPPYEAAAEVLAVVLDMPLGLLAKNGELILESEDGITIPNHSERWTLVKERRYGRTCLSILKQRG